MYAEINEMNEDTTSDPEKQADEWWDKLILDGGVDMNSHGDSNFMKARSLPSEVVEAHMSEFMETDPIKVVRKYISSATLKAEHIRMVMVQSSYLRILILCGS